MTDSIPSHEYLLLHYGELERENLGKAKLIQELINEAATLNIIIDTQRIEIDRKRLH